MNDELMNVRFIQQMQNIAMAQFITTKSSKYNKNKISGALNKQQYA